MRDEVIQQGQVKSFTKCIKILDSLAESNMPLSLSEVAEINGMNKPTCYRLLKTMKDHKLINCTKAKKYSLGPKLISLGLFAIEKLNILKIAIPIMKKINQETTENVNLSIIDGEQIVFVEIIHSHHRMHVHNRVGSRFPIYCSSMGKALLAFLPEEESEEIICKLEMKKFTENTHSSKESLKSELKNIRKQGFAVNNEELEKGLFAVAAPIIDATGLPVASIGISYVLIRYQDNKFAEKCSKIVMEATKEISNALGYF